MTLVRVVVFALLVSTAVHYTDNWLSIEDYAPRRGLLWENPGLVPVAWALFAAVGLLGLREYRRRGPTTRAHLLLGIFSVSGISTFGHLFYEGNSFAAWQWASVLSDRLLGLAVLGVTPWSAARVRPASARAA